MRTINDKRVTANGKLERSPRRRLLPGWAAVDSHLDRAGAVKLWDVSTRQELLTLGGTGSTGYPARWNAGGNVILAGTPWQSWHAPAWEEIAAAEANDKAEMQWP